MEMEDPIERTRWEEMMMVIDEADGSIVSQGQGGCLSDDMLAREILKWRRTMEGFEHSDQVGVPEEHGTDVSDGVVANLTDCFASGAYLSLYGNSLKEIPAGILPQLSQLQFLSVSRASGIFKTVRVEEVACLRRMETLRYQFCDLADFNTYLKSSEVRQPLTTYFFTIGQLGRCLELPEDVSALSIGRCHDARSLCDVSPFKHATSLKSFGMWECDEIECLLRVLRDRRSRPLELSQQTKELKFLEKAQIK
ncbi:hypothetical protein DKX38_025792 [Salix brachista]|uniref:Uncharacterized protein n=1 Tax=Salix brachista TaxID=2182728 RepID=A0A5N5JV87_9ROSI|nr:hypothetical protein DKX38_025792 [Salix brachista]